MSSIPSPIPALSPLRIQRHPRAVVVLTVVLLFAGGGLMMHAESQIQVLGLLAAFLVMFAIADRTPLGQDVSAICSDYSGFANAVAFVIRGLKEFGEPAQGADHLASRRPSCARAPTARITWV